METEAMAAGTAVHAALEAEVTKVLKVAQLFKLETIPHHCHLLMHRQ